MKKINNLGFTLIELLAVITIMGILMMVAIPSVSRTIENSRRDTFADNALTYVNTVRNAVMADELSCSYAGAASGTTVTASATPNGTYYFVINTGDQQTKDLMEKVALSSWGSAEIKGYVKWAKTTDTTTGRTTTAYSVRLADTGNHGFKAEVSEKDVSRAKIFTEGATQVTAPEGTAYACTLK